MRVLIFGAGASKPAGYPVVSNMVPAVEEFVSRDGETMLRAYWDRWRSWRDAADGVIRELLSNPNPEVVLSLPDLYETALKASNEDQLRRVISKWQRGELTEEDERRYKAYFESESHKRLLAARPALIGFLECLQRFFLYRHYADAKRRDARDYLRRHFARLSDGDVIITLNWDTTAERTLAEEGYWNPLTGYGFRKDLRIMPYGQPLPYGTLTKSKVTVLKLHGSIGWHPCNGGGVYFEHPRFLSNFGFTSNGKPLDLMDPQEPGVGPPEGSVLLYPSFLKQFSGAVMQQIWHEAGEALRNASGIEMYGYSLPESDLAVRTLLNVLRFRSESEPLGLWVHDPSTDAQERWGEFLGKRAVVDGRVIEEVPSVD
jgi:hypothetical protein